MNTIPHTHFIRAKNDLMSALDNNRPGRMIFLVGMSGVGKTTVRQAAFRSVYGNPGEWPPGKIPVVEVTASLPDRAYFSPKSLAIDLITELRSPRLSWLDHDCPAVRSYMKTVSKADSEWGEMQWRKLPEADAWRVAEALIRARGVVVISIDQATSMLVNRSNKTPADHIKHLISVAERLGIMFVLTGTERAAELWAVHEELRRRVEVIFAMNYSEKNEGDRASFSKLICSIAKMYPGANTELLRRMDVEILAATAGVYDEVCQLLSRASRNANRSGRTCLVRSDLEAGYYSARDLRRLWDQLRIFECVVAPGSVDQQSKLIRERWA